MDLAPASPDLAYRFGLVVLGLCQVVANHFKKDPTNEPFIFRIYTSLRRRLTRFDRVFARAQLERLAAARDAAASPGVADAAAAPSVPPALPVVEPPVVAPPVVKPLVAEPSPNKAGAGASGVSEQKAVRAPHERLPRKPGWLIMMIPYEASLYWYRLDDLLRDPEMVAFLATSRQARRLLRPLWYALCCDPLPACLREPPKPATCVVAPAVEHADADGVAPRRAAVGRRVPAPAAAAAGASRRFVAPSRARAGRSRGNLRPS